MKTDTRARILGIIEQYGKIRPAELQKTLNITPQAVHYHLRNLTKEGFIESKGSVPLTHYRLVGVPDLEGVKGWIEAPTIHTNPQQVCETRDVFTARLPQLETMLAQRISTDVLPLIIVSAGETGNNSFDHNLGQWRDAPGCWFEAQTTGGLFWICIADRGQGIFQSLKKIHSHLLNEQMALTAAFETIISGRAPEQRGNGLKFVREIIVKTPGAGIACKSGTAQVQYGEQGLRCQSLLEKNFQDVQGTMTLMTWRLQ